LYPHTKKVFNEVGGIVVFWCRLVYPRTKIFDVGVKCPPTQDPFVGGFTTQELKKGVFFEVRTKLDEGVTQEEGLYCSA